jgi:AAA+ superfamily predicted ATPase
MATTNIKDWNEANQRYLMAALRQVQDELEAFNAGDVQDGRQSGSGEGTDGYPAVDQEDQYVDPGHHSALELLINIFGLSSFEQKILLMCAGVELDGNFSRLISRLHGSSNRSLPSFGMALAVFRDAHWSALAPSGPLRYWRMIELAEGQHGQLLTHSPLKIDENILFYLTGVRQLDDRLRKSVQGLSSVRELVPSQLAHANTIIGACSDRQDLSRLPVIQLSGPTGVDKAAIAAYACSLSGLDLYTLPGHAIPHHSTEINDWVRIWNRQSVLTASALFLDLSDQDHLDRDRSAAIASFVEQIGGLLLVSTGQWMPKATRPVMVLDVSKPTAAEQLMLWQSSLGRPVGIADHQLERLVSQFNLSANTIHAVCNDVLTRPLINGAGAHFNALAPDPVDKALWKACCVHTRPQVDELAQRIETRACWDDIVLPEDQKEILREVAAQISQRNKVYGEWGFGAGSARGLGISVLFSGESGTGKTMASEVLANELQLDLYRIDLSQVVNKYIGETEKNLKRVFDAAEEGGAVLLFDEADALFGKRSEVKDSHDRYGNIEVSYLLQRMEAYRGLAILTTNMKSSLDKAFFRRIRFVVQFPFPDMVQRAEIWKRVFPSNTPTHGLDLGRLARLNIPGGNIRNIALNAAFIAAHEGRPVQMSHVSRAARSEYAKLDKPLNNLEIGMIG